MKQYDRLNEETIISISNLLTTCKSATELAAQIHFDISGIIKHIKSNRLFKETDATNKCGKKMICKHKNDICPVCH